MIASATVLRRIWTEDEEDRANTEVEQPAESGLEQLSESLQPSLRSHDRQAVAAYIMSLFRRGWQELVAQRERLHAELARLKAMLPAAGLSPATRQALEDEIAEESERPLGRPLPIRQISDVMAAMRWTVLQFPDPIFLTGDSPVQIAPHVIVNPKSEVTLPLTPRRALVCDWGSPSASIAIRTATRVEALEVNRRTALGAEQFIYFSDRPAESAVRELLEAEPRPRILDDKRRRAVPQKHRRNLERDARRILGDRKKENMDLIERIRRLETTGGLLLRDDDSPS